jgi:light-regulated signal transduction histidine kinase (bacteriophytochrome)
MKQALPQVHEAQQLCRLRALRVQRARERCGEAQGEVDRAARALRERQRQIERCQRELEALGRALVHSLAPRLPRWAGVAGAQRERLSDRLERDEYALISDEQRLEQAQERLQQARADFTRALAREDAVVDLAHRTRRAHALVHEQRVERELEDAGRGPALARRRGRG